MTKYKVYGSKTAEYYVVLEAEDADEAYDIANGDYVKWYSVDTDDAIEPHTVELAESDKHEDVQLNKDTEELPSMESGILIEGSN